jgi:hypothetical protein
MHYDNIYIRVASNIKKYRKEKGMTQEKLAEQTGYSFVNIRRIEAPNCKKSFSIETIYIISRVLDIPIYKLFEENTIKEDKENEK